MKRYAGYFKTFLEEFNIGWLRKFELDKSGMINICISASISGSELHIPSKKTKLSNQIEKLKSLGLELQADVYMRDSYDVVSCDNNRKVLGELLEKRGAKSISYILDSGIIEEIRFNLKPEDAEKFDTYSPSDAESDSPLVSADETEIAKSLLSRMLSALKTMDEQPELWNTCGYLVLSYFAELCEVFGLGGRITSYIDKKHEAERAHNKEIDALNKSISLLLSDTEVMESMANISDRLDFYMASRLGFCLDELSIDRFGHVAATVRYSPSLSYRWRKKDISDVALRAIFETIGNDREYSEDLYIKATDANREALLNKIREFIPSAKFSELHTKFVTDDVTIHKLSMHIMDIRELVNLRCRNRGGRNVTR